MDVECCFAALYCFFFQKLAFIYCVRRFGFVYIFGILVVRYFITHKVGEHFFNTKFIVKGKILAFEKGISSYKY